MTAEWDAVTPGEIAGGDKSALVIGPFGSNLKTSDFVPDGVPLVFVRNIREADFSRPRAYVTYSKADELLAHIALPGDVLVTKMGDPSGDACLYTGRGPAVITADCIRLRPSSKFDAGFIVHALRAPVIRRQIISITSGVAQQKVSLERFRSGVKFAVPPLDEQRRVARILDQADALQVKRRQILDHGKNLAQSVFVQMFGHLRAGKETVGDIAEIQGGLQVSSQRLNRPLTAPYLRVANIRRGRLDLEEVKVRGWPGSSVGRRNSRLHSSESPDPREARSGASSSSFRELLAQLVQRKTSLSSSREDDVRTEHD